MNSNLNQIFWAVTTAMAWVGCGSGTETTETETLPQKRNIPVLPLKVNHAGEVFLEEYKTDPLNLGLSLREGASFVYRDLVVENFDPEPQTIEYRFEEIPVLQLYSQLYWGVYQAYDTLVRHAFEKLYYIKHDFDLPEVRLRVTDAQGASRFESLTLQADGQRISVPGRSTVMLELVFNKPVNLKVQPMPRSCHDSDQKWYTLVGWKANIRYSRDFCVIQEKETLPGEYVSERRCLDQVALSALSRVSSGIGVGRASDTPSEVKKAMDQELGNAFPWVQNSVIDYSNLELAIPADYTCSRWIR